MDKSELKRITAQSKKNLIRLLKKTQTSEKCVKKIKPGNTILKFICRYIYFKIFTFLLLGYKTKIMHIYIYIYIYIRGSLKKFSDIFRMGTFVDSTRMKL